MRRSSLVTPLLLIGVGALLLARTLRPELPLMDYVARYWPFALIGWGALRAAEILYWAAASRPLPARGISGGDWLAIALVCLFGAGLHAARGITWTERIPFGNIEIFGGQTFDYPIEGEKASSPAPRVVLDNFRGDVQITGADAATVKVTGHKTIHSFDQRGADRLDRDSPLEIAGDSNRVVIGMRSPGGPLRLVTGTVEIAVPKGASIEAQGRNGNVRISNIQGAVNLSGRGADIDLQDIEGPVSISGARYASVQLRNVSKPLHFDGPQAQFSIEKLPGELRLAPGDLSGSNWSGPAHVSMRSRDVQISDFTGSLAVSVERGDIELRPMRLPLAHIEAHARSGDIRLSLPPAAQFTLDASTNNGEITNDFGGALKLDSGGRRTTLRGAVGNGPAIDIQTERGQIVVGKAVPGDATQVLKKLEQ
jgi:putative adhesin